MSNIVTDFMDKSNTCMTETCYQHKKRSKGNYSKEKAEKQFL
jgi:hypothetical protein